MIVASLRVFSVQFSVSSQGPLRLETEHLNLESNQNGPKKQGGIN